MGQVEEMQEIFRPPVEEEGHAETHASFSIGKETPASWGLKLPPGYR